MAVQPTWHTLVDTVESLPADATLVTPLSDRVFDISDVQEPRILIQYRDTEETVPLQRDQFETLVERVREAGDSFALDRLPPDAAPYATVLSVHPRFEVDEKAETLAERETSTGSPLVEATVTTGESDTERAEPDVAVYRNALLLIDALERHDVTALEEVETAGLVNIYTLLSDVQRNADDLRTTVAEVVLDRLHHDQPVSGQFGSVQRTSRRRRSLKDEEAVLEVLAEAGIDRAQVTSVDASKVDDALEVTDVSEQAVYDIDESEYVRKAEVDEAEKETRLQGLKTQLAAVDSEDADDLRAEIEDLEARIEELTEFRSGRSLRDAG